MSKINCLITERVSQIHEEELEDSVQYLVLIISVRKDSLKTCILQQQMEKTSSNSLKISNFGLCSKRQILLDKQLKYQTLIQNSLLYVIQEACSQTKHAKFYPQFS
ncbi:unnamed protein product (macronuclear) [Paramecium tetraurelia]|uniref:Uncharacterized protein n=1 Tax=Paramecium tetraurelia TaxID=5888 RepID=A0DW79_PARTE|nr:uncharacterized protein GSPATT00039799001 [Paramecium tetraurelia]CAK87296.1 unnamed protein product [Paramecium tetraurelia]|eukprot:XP_001454693.1 hypothetical protein (macronuclear) [Paramecium tetraurelia strain d4-2]